MLNKQTKQLVNVSISYHAKPGACDAFLNLYELQKVSAIHYDAKKSRSVVAAIKSINIKPAIYQIDHTIIILHICSLFNILLRLFVNPTETSQNVIKPDDENM